MTALDSSMLLWGEVVLVWAAANYLVCADPVRDLVDGIPVSPPVRSRWIGIVVARSLAAAVLVAWFCDFASIALPALVLAFCIGLPLLRVRVKPSYTAELETIVAAVFVAASSAMVFRGQLSSTHSPPWPMAHVSAGCLIVALFLLALRGGTYIVRGILDKCGALPPLVATGHKELAGETVIDYSEFNRGRLIGNLERILLVILVAFGNYEALGFLVAAKGLIRSKELEDRNWAEYFLVGTLASVLVAVGAGLCVRLVVKKLW